MEDQGKKTTPKAVVVIISPDGVCGPGAPCARSGSCLPEDMRLFWPSFCFEAQAGLNRAQRLESKDVIYCLCVPDVRTMHGAGSATRAALRGLMSEVPLPRDHITELHLFGVTGVLGISNFFQEVIEGLGFRYVELMPKAPPPKYSI